MQMDGLAAALSMTYSEKETLSSRWFIYLSQVIKLYTFVAIAFVIFTLPRAEARGNIQVIWGAQFDFSNQVPASVWFYGALRLLVEIHSSWQSLSWTRIINELEHQSCNTLTDHTPSRADETARRSRTDSRASILRRSPSTVVDIPPEEDAQESPRRARRPTITIDALAAEVDRAFGARRPVEAMAGLLSQEDLEDRPSIFRRDRPPSITIDVSETATDSEDHVPENVHPYSTMAGTLYADFEANSLSHPTVQDAYLAEVNLHEIYQSWPGTVFSTFLQQFAFSISALLSAEIVVAQTTVQDALSWGQTATMFSCAAGVLHWLYVQVRNVRKSGLFSRERYPVANNVQHLRTTLTHVFSRGTQNVKHVDYLRTNPLAFMAEIECRDNDETTPLIRAAKAGNYGSVQTLLDRPKAKPNLKDEMKRTPLLWAAQSGNAQIVKRLLQAPSIDPNIQDRQGRTPLCCSIINRHENVTRMLMTFPSTNANLKDYRGRTPLSWAAANGDMITVSRLLKSTRVNPTLEDDMGWTPIVWAAALGHQGVVKQLLAPKRMKKFAEQAPPSDLKRRPYSLMGLAITMLIATSPGAPQTTLFYLTKRAESFREHVWRKGTVLQSSAFCNDGTFAKMLMHAGANANGDSKRSSPPIQWAAVNGNIAVAQMLLENGADVDLLSGRQQLAVEAAARHELTTIIGHLFTESPKGNGPFRRFGYGTALYIAALNGDAEMVRLLLRHGADMHERGEHGTPLHVAAIEQHQEVIRLLLKRDKGYRHTRTTLIRSKNGPGFDKPVLTLCSLATCLAMFHAPQQLQTSDVSQDAV